MTTDWTATDHDHPPTSGHIRTASGAYVTLLDPDPDTIHLGDIAHALAHVCRFGGHLPSFYSVAEHSLHVAAMLHRQYGDPLLTFFGLMHDATEAYLGDMVRPLKQQLHAYRAAEDRMADVIGARFGLPLRWAEDVRVKHADETALVWEMATVRDAPWRTPTPPAVVREAFERTALRLLSERSTRA